MEKEGNTYAFIDSQNLNLGIKGCGWDLDFRRFFIYLKDKYKVSQAFLFIGFIPDNENLYAALRGYGYIVILKPTLEYKKDGLKLIKGNVDAELVLHTMIQYPHFDNAIIISGDGDFYCLLEYLKQKSKLGYLLVPDSRKYSKLLRHFEKYSVFLNLLRKKIEYKKPL